MSSVADSIDISSMRLSTVQYLYLHRVEIEMEPSYQRQGSVWSQDKQQLLLDSLINEFDVPKIYFHQYDLPIIGSDEHAKKWALVDGRQRLEAIFGFLEGAFPLSEDFVHLATGDHTPAGRTYQELEKSHPLLIGTLNSTVLDVIVVRTSDLELIEEMFSRLNEAVPLNAAEKRNALGGLLPGVVRELVELNFFKRRVPFTNSRYRHFDLAAKFLYWFDAQIDYESDDEPDLARQLIIRDAKKVRLDEFFRRFPKGTQGKADAKRIQAGVERNLGTLDKTFVDSDSLLNSVGMISIYFLLFELRYLRGQEMPGRSLLVEFDIARKVRRVRSDSDLSAGEYEMLEFGRLSQSPNDASALHYRLRVMDAWLGAREAGNEPMQAVEDAFREDSEERPRLSD